MTPADVTGTKSIVTEAAVPPFLAFVAALVSAPVALLKRTLKFPVAAPPMQVLSVGLTKKLVE
jgi:hypothetical protein